MSVIKRQIWVTQRLRIQPIDVVYGSQVGISLQLMDYDIPSRAAANAYARGKNTTATYISPCTISGNTVSFTPEDGFFAPGLNLLQIEINGAIIPFSVNVICEGRISELGDSAPPEQVRPLVERAVAAAAAAEAASNNASESATEAAGSANAAKSSETNAKNSETAAKTAATTAANEANAAVAPLVERAETAATDAETALGQVPEAASTAVQPLAERAESAASAAETAATRAEQALQTMEANYQDVGQLQTKLKSGKIEDADLHLGWYLDADGNLRPKERSINMGDQSLTGLPTPTADADAATKGYVDTMVKGQLVPEMHRNIFRGKNLGSSVTADQKAAIKDGSFEDLYVGDYWTIGGVNWRIVDINYWMRCGDTDFTTPHLVIMPDTALYDAKMNETNIATGGYVGSLMYTTYLETAKTTIANAFGDMVLTHREFLTNAVTNGYPSAGAWYDSTVELPNEIMMYGSHIFAPAGDGTVVPARHTISKSQLALFKLVPKFIHNRQWFWLRDVVSAAGFAHVSGWGDPYYAVATGRTGVRPVFAIG